MTGIDEYLAGTIERTRYGQVFSCQIPELREECECLFNYLDNFWACLNRENLPEQLKFFASKEKVACIDIESCGLSYSSPIFLVGQVILNMKERRIEAIEALLARDYLEEPAMLSRTFSSLDNVDGILTFNGKSFDLTRLDARASAWNIPSSLYRIDHLDLYRSKEVKHALISDGLSRNDMSLQTFEKLLLGFRRRGDKGGALAPKLYKEYLTGKRKSDSDEKKLIKDLEACEGLKAVITHNLIDTLSIACLFAYASLFYNQAGRQ
jgi:uncharacterized protein YprB with RNaseH-like and TPR domain